MKTGTIQQVPSFRTTDGVLHETRLEAITHQFELDARNIFAQGSAQAAFNEKTAAHLVAKNFAQFDELIKSYRPRIQAATKSAQRATV